jgi:hypothetical protein
MTTIMQAILLHQISATTYPNPEKNQTNPNLEKTNLTIQSKKTKPVYPILTKTKNPVAGIWASNILCAN